MGNQKHVAEIECYLYLCISVGHWFPPVDAVTCRWCGIVPLIQSPQSGRSGRGLVTSLPCFLTLALITRPLLCMVISITQSKKITNMRMVPMPGNKLCNYLFHKEWYTIRKLWYFFSFNFVCLGFFFFFFKISSIRTKISIKSLLAVTEKFYHKFSSRTSLVFLFFGKCIFGKHF